MALRVEKYLDPSDGSLELEAIISNPICFSSRSDRHQPGHLTEKEKEKNKCVETVTNGVELHPKP